MGLVESRGSFNIPLMFEAHRLLLLEAHGLLTVFLMCSLQNTFIFCCWLFTCSQSLSTLSLIEKFLGTRCIPKPSLSQSGTIEYTDKTWKKGLNYYSRSFVYLHVCLSACLLVCLSVRLSVCLSVCLFFSYCKICSA